ncbi:hypothetical protein LEP1GSC047_3521 [Leptospira inadai serovar Lyme str. 10]|uniref:Uncharacterized protein n=1 Tax=Leptospira inadai serovar Lyme str. 10 TaxID=1049790 RepID=V6HWI9_9LEPT|nr:hypothetical protein LEP1GSC047_3521 [Leptospira inadai serovar Lyme str. 10]
MRKLGFKTAFLFSHGISSSVSGFKSGDSLQTILESGMKRNDCKLCIIHFAA